MIQLPVAASILFLACAGMAAAQTDPMAQARVAAYNQVGIMEYCQSSGFASPADVTAQRGALSKLPSAPVTPEMTSAETAGRSGTIASPNGTSTTLAAMAAQTHVSVADLCGHMVTAAKQLAAMNAAGGMPAMPTGIPNMPGGMLAMPSMPGMPAMPGATPAR